MLLTFLSKYREGGLLFLRIGLGVMFVIHGAPKIMGGPAHWATLGKSIGYMGIHGYPAFWGFMAAFSECFGGIFVILGLFFRPACILLALTMIVASTMLAKQKKDFQKETSRPIELAIVFASLVVIGPGKYSIDKS
jgi:putative oxidoreductase